MPTMIALRTARPPSRDFHGRFIRGEKPRAGWVSETDFEKEPIKTSTAGF
ncbi:MAG: hypothetical protein ACREH8_16415 [Opitutaceae bacterium]